MRGHLSRSLQSQGSSRWQRMDGTMSLKCTWLWSLKVLSIGGFHYVFRGPQRWLSRSEHLPYNHEDLSLSPSRHVERWAVGVHVPESSVPLEADGRRVAGASYPST